MQVSVYFYQGTAIYPMTTYVRRCSNCGSEIEVKSPGGVAYCAECKEFLKEEKKKERPEQEVKYRIEFDPIPIERGGFRPGAKISQMELTKMCQAEYRAFTAGTILVDNIGKRYIVRDRKDSNSQEIIAIEEPLKSGLSQGVTAPGSVKNG